MFAENLKQLRKTKGLTQTQFASEFNISSGTIAMWETGKRMPDTETLKKIAQYFNVSIDYLLDNEKSPLDDTEEPEDEELIILNRNAKNLTPEQRKQLLDMAKIMFKEDWDD
ncbi:MAG: helix-turn-helix transcriptional regulator [Acutalibacteraceae bacterium]|nr:helix-turn-helix transcriptional regulator [Acutalibacteraceae bacterium]